MHAPPERPASGRDTLALVTGIAAAGAPALHLLTDVLEWIGGGFSPAQLWLNYVAFVPMSWLLLAIHLVRRPRSRAADRAGIAGALLYGAAFTYFAFTTLYAIVERLPDYATLWHRLGSIYTVHGGLMVAGGLLFGGAALRARTLPKTAVALFLAGIVTNLVLAFLPAPEILQTAGSTLRNLGLIAIGVAILGPWHSDRDSGSPGG
ncbi:MAG: hypothetical protein AB7G12_16515 [Thermoanaerobaculia bacterium]